MKTSPLYIRIPCPIRNAVKEIAAEMKVSETTVWEMAAIEFCFKRDNKISTDLLQSYKAFIKSIKK